MNLSNRLTFSLVFSVLLVALFAFIATPAMAQFTVSYAGAVTAPEAGVIVTLTYSVNANPKPVKADFTTDGTAALDANITFTETDAKTFVLTDPDSTSIEFVLRGYTSQNVNAGDTGTLAVAADHLPGLGYVIVANNNTDSTADTFPTLPLATFGTDGDVEKAAWFEVDGNDDTTDATGDGAMPDLYRHFQIDGGGTINLRVNKPGGTDRIGGSNGREVVINEVMWAYDNALVGDPTRNQQQWIELRNMRTTPIAYSDIVLTTSKSFPAPAAETDRLSNNPAFNNTWSVTGKGQHGNSGGTAATEGGVLPFTRVEFVSMERVNYDNGWDSGRWASAVELYLPNFKGTPGTVNRPRGIQGARTVAGATNPPKNKVIVNEIGLSETSGHDWIELKNVSGSAVNIKKWTISLSTGYDNETVIYRFRDNDKFPGDNHAQSIPAGGHLLLVFANPASTPLAVGVDVLLPDRDQAFGHSDHKFVYVGANKNLPNGSDWLIIIRSNHEDKFLKSSHHIQDVAGPGGNGGTFKVQDINAASPRKNKKSDGNSGGDIWHTKVWPLQNQNHRDNFLRRTNLPTEDVAWYRRLDKGGGQGWQHDSFGNGGYASIGYDRGADPSKYKGTPGYPNNSHKAQVGHITDGKVVISELMLTTDDGRYPQWLELHNTSKTSAVNLGADHGWRLVIESHDSDQWAGKRDLVATINFKSNDDVKSIPPNQTVLLVSTISTRTSSRSTAEHFPRHRVYDVYTNDRGAFYMANRRAPFLNTNGFHIKLIDGRGNVSDEIGNLDGNNRTYDTPYSWEWPAEMTADDERSSLIRVKNADGTHRVGVPDRAVEGDMRGAPTSIGEQVGAMSAWRHAVDTNLATVQDTYYGSQDDFGTPGHTSNTPLPVSLSFFRPTLENGEVVIHWTTESELDNAGFNILRSDSKDGEFKQVNSELVQGAGTIGERNTYKWVDESAKPGPGVVYYYQIEDVSFAGERQTLTTTKLKGLISADNKLTTLWGGLKSQD